MAQLDVMDLKDYKISLDRSSELNGQTCMYYGYSVCYNPPLSLKFTVRLIMNFKHRLSYFWCSLVSNALGICWCNW